MIERDRHMLETAKVDSESFRKQIGVTNRYSAKQEFNKTSQNMKKIIRQHVPELVKRGLCHLSVDHKYVGCLTKESGDHGLSVLLTVGDNNTCVSYTLSFTACESTANIKTLPIIEDTLKVDNNIEL